MRRVQEIAPNDWKAGFVYPAVEFVKRVARVYDYPNWLTVSFCVALTTLAFSTPLSASIQDTRCELLLFPELQGADQQHRSDLPTC